VSDPFRTADPTEAAQLEREREASFERVLDATTVAIEIEQRRVARRERLRIAAFVLALVIALGTIVLTIFDSVAGPFVCPAIALVLVTGVALFHRRKARG
jgi:hypothetical protein